MADVQLESVEKRYENGTFAVKGITFDCEDGEFVVLVGPSGCGKSTTLRMIAGLEEITGGAIKIGGKIVNDLEPKDRDVAMVFQNYALYPHMTVFENMAFPLKMRKVDRATIKKQVEEAAQLLSIHHLLDRKPKALSGGERQRVAVGRAIVRKPKVFLFDEPLSNLDAALRTQMRAELKRIQRRLGATMLYVTHDQVEAMTMGDKIAVLNKGQLEQFGTPAEIYDRPATTFVARFLGTPAMNLIEGNIRGGVFESGKIKVRMNASHAQDRSDVTLGIRPEAVRVLSKDEVHGTDFVEGKLVLIEPIGSVTHYYIDAPEAFQGTLVASEHQGREGMPGAESAILSSFRLGENVRFAFSPSAIHLFDRTSGKRIA